MTPQSLSSKCRLYTLIPYLLFILLAIPGAYGRQRVSGQCSQGGKTVITAGIVSTTKVLASYPSCTVTVYLSGTVTLATLYADNSSTPRANPFTADANGYWFFYADNNRYDAQMSGAGMSTWTMGDLLLADPAGFSASVSSFNGRTGNVTPATNDYNFNNLAGTINVGSQIATADKQGTDAKLLSSGTVAGAGNTLCLDGSGGATTAGCNGSAAITSAYDFGAYSCNSSNVCVVGGVTGASLSIGNNVLTFSPVPVGVAGSHTVAGGLPHLMYVAGGTGAAEGCVISGGAGTSGQTSGQIIINCANTHSGAFGITSNTSGVQEAVYVAGVTGSVRMPAGPIHLWANTSTVAALNIPSGYGTSLRGQGDPATFVRTHGTTGDWINYLGNGYADMGDFFIVADLGAPGIHTAGSMIRISNTIGGSVDNIYAQYCFDCIIGVGINGNTHFTRLSLYGAHDGFLVTGSTSNNQFTLSDSTLHGERTGIRIEATTTVGVYITNNLVDQVNVYGMALATGAAMSIRETTSLLPTNEITLTGNDFEAVGTGVEMVGANSPFQNNSTTITGGRINSTYCGVCAYSGYNGIKVDGVPITVSNGTSPVTAAIAAIQLQSATNYTLQNNTITAIGTPVAINYSATGNNGGKISGNLIGFQSTPPVLGISITGADSVQVENNYINSSSTPFTIGASVTSLSARGNIGVDNIIPAIASAATLAFPVNPTFTLTGSTNTTAVTFPLIAGSEGKVTATDSTLTFTAGASIGNTFILKRNTPASWYWDGTKIWLIGQDPTISSTRNYIATEAGANNAITGTLTGVSVGDGLCVTIQLAHTLQAGANTFALNGGSAVAIKSSRNTANNIGTAYAVTGRPTLCYSSTIPAWVDVSQ